MFNTLLLVFIIYTVFFGVLINVVLKMIMSQKMKVHLVVGKKKEKPTKKREKFQKSFKHRG